MIVSSFNTSMINAFAHSYLAKRAFHVSLIRETETETDSLHRCNDQLAHIDFLVLLHIIITPRFNPESGGLLLTQATLFENQRVKK